ncbi:hypothetical protein OC846_003162 [Tilletia horrida]|uniref:Ricin B lectin domain-containing protein n=1 Tax=Tilletia horrida TaxID=155126 RepID=A0AAN6GQJ1_9BASI|nr:hypothetical protein OC846_003162 [Tilletia horrida]KAK0561638.1 hypothetical protein OC861_005721 [Tilletia horrida]
MLLSALLSTLLATVAVSEASAATTTPRIKCSSTPLHSGQPFVFLGRYAGNFYVDLSIKATDSAKRPALPINRAFNFPMDGVVPQVDFYTCNSTYLGYKNGVQSGDDQLEITDYYGQIRYNGKCVTLETLNSTTAHPLVLDTCKTTEGASLLTQWFNYHVESLFVYYGMPRDVTTSLNFVGKTAANKGAAGYMLTNRTLAGHEVVEYKYSSKGFSNPTGIDLYVQ